MAFFCALVMRGNSKPLVVLFTSSKAEALAVLPSVFTESDWVLALLQKNKKSMLHRYFIK